MNKILACLSFVILASSSYGDNVKVLFNSPLVTDKPLDRCDSDSCRELLKLVKGAKSSIRFAIYGIRNQSELFNALVEAKRRGIVVEGVVDRDVNGKSYYPDTDKLVKVLGNVVDDYGSEGDSRWDDRDSYCEEGVKEGNKGYVQCVGHSLDWGRCIISSQSSKDNFSSVGSLMHNKFFVVDDRYVWTGSMNISDSGTGGYNANSVIVFDSVGVASLYSREFRQMYDEGKFHGKKKGYGISSVNVGGIDVSIGFSPKDGLIDNGLKGLLLGAKKSIDVSVFYFTSKELAMYLSMAKRKGVKVRVIIDATSAVNGYSKHEVLRGSGIDVKVENWGGKMHSKSVVIDDEVFVGGSMNWTSKGNWSNDENVVIIRDRKIAREGRKYFDMLWGSIDDKWLEGNPNPEGLDSGSSCYDGVDNDFDGLVDKEDKGCRGKEKLDTVASYRIVWKKEGNRLVKGNISKKGGKKIYHVYGSKYYDKTKIGLIGKERWFCSEYEARYYGWIKSKAK